jgi:hypothetical protein
MPRVIYGAQWTFGSVLAQLTSRLHARLSESELWRSTLLGVHHSGPQVRRHIYVRSGTQQGTTDQKAVV